MSISFFTMSSGPRVLTGRVCVVTGGSRGIGKEFVKQLVRQNNLVIAGVRNPSEALELRTFLTAFSRPGKEHRLLKLDLTNEDSIRAFAESLSPMHVDVLINNAGVYGERKLFGEFTMADFQKVFTTNAAGTFMVVQEMFRAGCLGYEYMAGEDGKSQSPSIVANVTSMVASHALNNNGGGYAYRASKAALNIINKSLSLDLKEAGIECVLLHPGYVKTDMTGPHAWIDASESVAGMIRVLETKRPLNGKWYDYTGKEVPV